MLCRKVDPLAILADRVRFAAFVSVASVEERCLPLSAFRACAFVGAQQDVLMSAVLPLQPLEGIMAVPPLAQLTRDVLLVGKVLKGQPVSFRRPSIQGHCARPCIVHGQRDADAREKRLLPGFYWRPLLISALDTLFAHLPFLQLSPG